MKPEKEKMVELTEDKIDLAGAMERLKSPEIGAIASYFGSVRNTSKGKNTASLTYPGEGSSLVLEKMKELRKNALNKYDIRDAMMIQRIGYLKPGDNILFVGISAATRTPAFEACSYIIDRIKAEVHPGWKKEKFQSSVDLT
ncbi:molybdopterin synthase catalytic subunit [Desulfosarcina sp. BuS5]|uniref:molybdenum cofactor biosynthesis protein MoaE n=1 Tax=Desulfosarcina sp. BuS5 TaxID=933262 RepID=UPI000683EB6E|nr:molybdenum cofactor biosynthesis protein MoaE [Desulfosarcina sp. BuS5]WDN87162.1 molybdopterin synthase catalytic subunit [Desulfosarcina sp. BuS5]